MELPWKSLTFTFIIIIILNSQLTHGARDRVKTTFVRRYLPFPVIQATTPRELNTSVAFTVPLLSLSTDTPVFDLLPWGIPKGTKKLIVVIAISAVIISLAVIFLSPSVAVLSAILEQHNQLTSGRSLDGLSSFMTNRLSDLLHTLAYNSFNGFPGIDLDECVKRSICEAHNQPSNYGWMAFPFKLFFPPYIGVRQDNDPSQLSKYQLAAQYGKSDNANCGLQYRRCMINPPSVIRKIAGWFFEKKRK